MTPEKTVSDYIDPENGSGKSKCMNKECGKFAVEYMTCSACGMIHDPDYEYDNELEKEDERGLDNRMLLVSFR